MVEVIGKDYESGAAGAVVPQPTIDWGNLDECIRAIYRSATLLSRTQAIRSFIDPGVPVGSFCCSSSETTTGERSVLCGRSVWWGKRQSREVSDMGTEATRPPKVPPPWFKHTFWRVHRALYRLSGGHFLWTTSNKRGWGALSLTTIGRKSGHERSVIVGYVEDGPNLVVLAMNGWDEGHPSWWLNLEAHRALMLARQ